MNELKLNLQISPNFDLGDLMNSLLDKAEILFSILIGHFQTNDSFQNYIFPNPSILLPSFILNPLLLLPSFILNPLLLVVRSDSAGILS